MGVAIAADRAKHESPETRLCKEEGLVLRTSSYESKKRKFIIWCTDEQSSVE